MPPAPMAKTAQRISANNTLGNHEDQSPQPVLRESTHGGSVYDKLASNIGLLRTMFKENAQRPLCPHIDEIGPAIVKAFHFTDAGDISAVYELLVMSQRATGHPIAEFDVFSRVLREHAKKRETTARKSLVKKQQMLALRGMKNAGGMGAGAGGQQMPPPQQSPRGDASSSSARAMPASAIPPPPAARSQSDWVAFLNQFSSKGDARLNWVEFAGALQNLPHTWRRGQSLEPNELWGARAFFMTCASVENHPQSTESRVGTSSLSAYFVGNKVVARTSKSVAMGSTIRSAMSWEEENPAYDGITTSVTSARRAGGASNVNAKKKAEQEAAAAAAGGIGGTPRGQQNRALRLRNEAQKKWIVAHPTDPATGNTTTERLPKLA